MLPGGVCAVLDYEVSQMTDYVAEMAQRLCNPGPQVSTAFRKFVSGLLSSTRLPSTTILLGLNYLARRLNTLSNGNATPFKANDGQVWRMLTIGLLLGSKFLDDNTFQNRSWSEWNLYVNLDESKDFQAWLQNWKDWRATKNIQRTATLDRLAPLAPIDTNVQRSRPYPQQPYTGYTKTPSSREKVPAFHSNYDSAMTWNPYPTPHLTPPSAPDSGLNTPEYMSATGGGPRYDWTAYDQYSRGYQAPSLNAYAPQPRVAAYHTPFTSHFGHPHYGSNIWDANVADCTCNNCNPHAKQAYFMTNGYAHQIAA
ncbi:putative meiotically up-regulated gene 80 protein [Amylocarpus encephaloides]|uniref:Meiotically up-regulated gene 80 protein n=1 Tax=Amylocarpus encephaloides TaxID=45428 RepID=A0A9P7YJW1_9HELO|nr:putative meiotically up-regulated gene 80 protein [Amylocarpus encephaloides]